MHELYELKEKLCEELEKYGQQDLTAGSLEVIDKLAHAIKNLHKIIEAAEEEEYSMEGGSYESGGSNAYARGGNQGGGNRGGQGGGRSNRSYRGYAREGGSYAYARGRGRNARRDSMGRYARNEGEYSMADSEEMVQNLRELMEEAPDEMTKREFQKFIQKIEMM